MITPVVVQAVPVQAQPQPQATFLPMQRGMCISRFFEPVFSTTLPLEWNEFEQTVAEVDGVMQRALPAWLRKMPLVFPIFGFALCLVGILTMVMWHAMRPSFTPSFSSGEAELQWSSGTPAVGIVLFTCGFVVFAGGAIGTTCFLNARSGQAISDVRRKLSELNARYASRGVDFQLHESRHLEFYNSSSAESQFSGRRVHSVVNYTLVVQTVASGVATIPAPDVLSDHFQQARLNVV